MIKIIYILSTLTHFYLFDNIKCFDAIDYGFTILL